jgi:hypothetical protein
VPQDYLVPEIKRANNNLKLGYIAVPLLGCRYTISASNFATKSKADRDRAGDHPMTFPIGRFCLRCIESLTSDMCNAGREWIILVSAAVQFCLERRHEYTCR